MVTKTNNKTFLYKKSQDWCQIFSVVMLSPVSRLWFSVSHNYNEAGHQDEEMIITSSDYDTTRVLKVTITVRSQL